MHQLGIGKYDFSRRGYNLFKTRNFITRNINIEPTKLDNEDFRPLLKNMQSIRDKYKQDFNQYLQLILVYYKDEFTIKSNENTIKKLTDKFHTSIPINIYDMIW